MTPQTLAALHSCCFTVPRPWSAAEFAALLARPEVLLLGDARGFLLGRVAAGEAEVLTLAVAQECRRRGLGAALVETFCADARRKGAESAFLEVAETNAAAIALYRRAGFSTAGRRPGYYRGAGAEGAVAALIMARGLAHPPDTGAIS